MTGVGVGSPSNNAAASVAISSGVKPARAAVAGFTWNTTAGPLVVFWIPSATSTTGFLFPILISLMASPTWGAHWVSKSALGENIMIWIGWGAPVRSPIMSCSTWGKSIFTEGSDVLILP